MPRFVSPYATSYDPGGYEGTGSESEYAILGRRIQEVLEGSPESAFGNMFGVFGGIRPSTTRLYRGEPVPSIQYQAPEAPSKYPDWLRDAVRDAGIQMAQGRWFTDQPEIAEWYRREADFGPSQVSTIKIPVSEAEQYRVSNLPQSHVARSFSADPEREFFVPQEQAATRQASRGFQRLLRRRGK